MRPISTHLYGGYFPNNFDGSNYSLGAYFVMDGGRKYFLTKFMVYDNKTCAWSIDTQLINQRISSFRNRENRSNRFRHRGIDHLLEQKYIKNWGTYLTLTSWVKKNYIGNVSAIHVGLVEACLPDYHPNAYWPLIPFYEHKVPSRLEKHK